MLELALHPAFILFVGAVLIALTRPSLRPLPLLLTPIVALWAIWRLPDDMLLSIRFLGYDIELLQVSAERRLFATAFAITSFVGGLYGMRQARSYELSACYAYAAGAVGVSFAGDLLAMYLCWEAMVIFSTIVIWCGGTDAARRAGLRYALMQVIGGVILKIGIEAVSVQTGSFDIRPLDMGTAAAWIVLVGVLIKAAAPPVSAWLADAYPEASPFGSVFLTALTTKTAVLALILLFPGAQVLLLVGLSMVLYGIIYALLENDIRRILAYAIINQVGFMLCAVGIGTELALNGAAAFAFGHIISLTLLMMSAGAVLQQTGMRKASDLGGLYRAMPMTTLCAIIGALAISAFPLTSGYISHAMIYQAAAEQQLAWVWYLLLAGSAGVVLLVLKFVWQVFLQPQASFPPASGQRPADPPRNMQAAMILYALASIVLGCFPSLLYGVLPYPTTHQAYAGANLVGQLQLLLFAVLAFVVMLPAIKRSQTITLDLDWVYRVALIWLARKLAGTWQTLLKPLKWLWRRKHIRLQRIGSLLLPTGALARTSPTGSMTLWVTVILVLVVVLAQ